MPDPQRPCQTCGTRVLVCELELDLQGRAGCRTCRGHAASRAVDEQLADHGLRRRCRCGAGTLVQNQPSSLGHLVGGGIGGYSRAAIVIGHRYDCEQCGNRVWFGSATGVGIWVFVCTWFGVVLLVVDRTPLLLALTAVGAGGFGVREAWLRRRYPRA
ncbi:MAG TPA: hypothetical protein VJV79_24590 [Polyangiaceae bacterium]|nr:hypothetical protein [Polyangiaceae bacterium]